MSTELHLFPDVVLVGPRFEERRETGVVIRDGVIAEIADASALRGRGAETITLPGQALMAGFVNAHQHGRGCGSFQLGFADDVLETWIAGLRAAGVLDPYAQTLIACLDMIAAGVKIIKTSDELNRAFLKAYDEIHNANASKDEFYRKVVESQKKYSSLVVPYRLSYWPNYNFIAEHYYKDKIWLK